MKPKKSNRRPVAPAVAAEPVEVKAPEVEATAPTAAPDGLHRVLFDVHVGGAREVFLAGTFNDWHPTTLPMISMGMGRWEKEVLIPPGRHEYLLIADGRWMPDPGCGETVPNPFGGVNCVRHVG